MRRLEEKMLERKQNTLTIKIPRKIFNEFSNFKKLKHYNEPHRLTLFTTLIEKMLDNELKKHKKHDNH